MHSGDKPEERSDSPLRYYSGRDNKSHNNLKVHWNNYIKIYVLLITSKFDLEARLKLDLINFINL